MRMPLGYSDTTANQNKMLTVLFWVVYVVTNVSEDIACIFMAEEMGCTARSLDTLITTYTVS
jgi:hypothetical protein